MSIKAVSTEFDLTNKLSSALLNGKRADFALLLKYLNDDVSQQAQFKLQQSEDSPDISEQALKASLGVHDFYKLRADQQTYKNADQINLSLHQSGITQAKLAGYLNPEAISQFNDVMKIDESVLTNCRIHTQAALNQVEEQAESEQILDATQLYEVLEQLQ
ncbi:VC2046/SO_2500 family protein [Catenovulum maritimum]|uniref:Uncharacterized protein n=1 Tax=Catenovulum maritimum TaxID=1513271 RepID=A0A0J8GRU2_9ALTE|nr:VC2046/SO_2500 family protein [Catenovulum maritimum]KMT65510.1 hypothetical protein XM47_09175 [Catenovulum maritimum]